MQLAERAGGDTEGEWCYLPNESGKYAAGMRPASNHLQRMGYRLPTDAEWEYACRAGAETAYSCGEANEILPKYAWYNTNSLEKSAPVGLLKPNDLGLWDMHGNLQEWTQDAFKVVPKSRPGEVIEDKEDTPSPISEGRRMMRGGSFYGYAVYARASFRNGREPTLRSDIGLRPARTVTPEQPVSS